MNVTKEFEIAEELLNEMSEQFIALENMTNNKSFIRELKPQLLGILQDITCTLGRVNSLVSDTEFIIKREKLNK